MNKVQKFWSEVLQAIGVYVFTLFGILMSQYGPLILQPAKINMPLQLVRFGFSAGIALYLCVIDEGRGDADSRRENLKRRLARAFTHGATWNVVMGIGVAAIQVAGGG